MPTLILTLGLGNLDRPEETLFTPLRKSLAQGKWERIILLPSKKTEPLALQLAAGAPEFSICPLPTPGDEDDPDACFSHFESTLTALIQAGTPAHSITIDFTRGTKAMSAAIVLAGLTLGIPKLRYVTGPRERDGLVSSGKEEVRDVSPAIAINRRNLDLAAQLMLQHQFSAAKSLFPQEGQRWLRLYPEPCRNDIEWTVWAAGFWGAWDRFDYCSALSLLDQAPSANSRRLDKWRCSKPQAQFLKRLANQSPSRGNLARDLTADLLANAGRRLAADAFEDTLLRTYRALEMIGQARLFDQALDSEDPDWGHPAARQLRTTLRYEPRHLDRHQVVSLLELLGDPFASQLDRAARSGTWDRNRSILLHGFSAEADSPKARGALRRVTSVFGQENPKNAERLACARFPNSEP